jgi:hypothetical protein
MTRCNIDLVKKTFMKKKCWLLLVSLCSFSLLWGQNKKQLPNSVKVGEFYYYPKDSKESYYDLRNDSILGEINLSTRDTSIWRIRWQSDSVIEMRYVTGSRKLTDAQRAFRHAHTIVVRIDSVAAEYYTFSGGMDSVGGIGNTQDTMWFKPKIGRN